MPLQRQKKNMFGNVNSPLFCNNGICVSRNFFFFTDIHIKKLYGEIISTEDQQKCNSNYQGEKHSQPSGLSVCTHFNCDMLLMESE